MTDLINGINIKNIDSLVTVRSERGDHIVIFQRPTYGLSFCIDGQITYEHNGKKYIQDRHHAVILPEGESYLLYRDKSGTFPLINFTCHYPICSEHIIIPIDDPESCISDYEKLVRLSLLDGNRLKMISVFYNLLHRILAPDSDGTLTPAVKYIETNFNDTSINNSLLAQKCNLSETHFRKLFLAKFGITPRQFIIDLRINQAKQLLATGSLKISAIAEACGFSSQYHFSRCFKAHTTMTPTEYMILNRNHVI